MMEKVVFLSLSRAVIMPAKQNEIKYSMSILSISNARAAPRDGLGWTCQPRFPQVGIHF